MSKRLTSKAMTKRLTQEELHLRIIGALGSSNISWASDPAEKPLELDLEPPLPTRVRIYAFNATKPPGGRPVGEHKVQLIMPGQSRGQRGNFDNSGNRIVLLVGYVRDDEVFVFWDAGLYADFAWSRNVQVKSPTVISASAGKISKQKRTLRPADGTSVVETVVAGREDKLPETILERISETRTRMMQ